jgi:hypothetical protein
LKCLREIWRTQQKYRLTLVGQEGFKGFDEGFDSTLTMVDQRVSLGFVGDVFEVMAQVDHCLTIVTAVGRFIRVK